MFHLNIKNITLAGLFAAGIATLGVMSCTKKVATDSYSQFLGEWRVSDACSGFETPSFKVAAGTNSYSVKMSYKMGYKSMAATTTRDSCQREVTVEGLVNGDVSKDYFSINNQVVTDECGHNYSISGGATIRRAKKDNERDTLKLTVVTTTTGGSSACSFNGYQ